MYRQSEKNLLSSNIFPTCPHNMVNFVPLAAEIVSLVSGTPGNFNGFRVLAALLHGTLLVGVRQTGALNRGRHLYSAGRPSRWALAHISSLSNASRQTTTTVAVPELNCKYYVNRCPKHLQGVQPLTPSCCFFHSNNGTRSLSILGHGSAHLELTTVLHLIFSHCTHLQTTFQYPLVKTV